MGKNYINFWRDKENGRLFTHEADVAGSYKDAVDDYKDKAGMFPYSHTFVWDDEDNIYERIDIETELEEQERMEQAEADADYQEDISNQAYWGWKQAGSGIL